MRVKYHEMVLRVLRDASGIMSSAKRWATATSSADSDFG